MYSTNFPADEFEDAVRQLIDSANFLTGAKAKVEKMIVVSTEDLSLSSALDSLADSMKARKNGKATTSKKLKKGKKVEEHDPISMGRASWRTYDGEIISTMKLHQRLEAGEFADNTTFTNFKGERWVVMDGELIKEPQE